MGTRAVHQRQILRMRTILDTSLDYVLDAFAFAHGELQGGTPRKSLQSLTHLAVGSDWALPQVRDDVQLQVAHAKMLGERASELR